MEYFKEKYLMDPSMKGCSVLDVGSRNVLPDTQLTYKYIFKEKFRYYGMDVEPGNNVDLVGFESLEGKTFDIVITGQTLEHVKRPWEWIKNLTKYFDKYICVIAPHSFKEHRFPIDTYRYLPDGMRDLFEYAGIKPIEILKNKIDTMGIGIK